MFYRLFVALRLRYVAAILLYLGYLVGIVGAALAAFGCGVASFRSCVRWTKGAIFETVQRVFPSFHYALLSIGDIFGRIFIIGERYLI